MNLLGKKGNRNFESSDLYILSSKLQGAGFISSI